MNVYHIATQVLLLTTLLLSVTFQSTPTERKATFQNIYQIIVDQYKSSQSYFDFIATIQSNFCPDQPICTRADSASVTSTSSASTFINNLTFIGDIHDLTGMCCLPCSCEDTCVEHGSCCMTKTALGSEPNSHTKQSRMERMCIPASSRSYFGRSGQDLDIWYTRYSMITQCSNRSDEDDTVSKCEQPKDHTGPETKVPVTSLVTGETYWNYPCARCNDDFEDVVVWNATVIYQRNRLFYFTNKSEPTPTFLTFEAFYDTVINAEEITFTPPNLTSIERARCYPNSARGCPRQNSMTKIPENEFMFKACEQFTSLISIGRMSFYRNIFCFFCGGNQVFEDTSTDCKTIQEGKNPSKSLSSLFNYQLQKSEIEDHDDKKRGMRTHAGLNKCSCDEMFDNYLVCTVKP